MSNSENKLQILKSSPILLRLEYPWKFKVRKTKSVGLPAEISEMGSVQDKFSVNNKCLRKCLNPAMKM